MAKWIDDLGDNLAKQHPDIFRLSPERHWEVKSGNQWKRLPDHYLLGFIMALGGGIGAAQISETESIWSKLFFGAMTFAGLYLVLDDYKDLEKDIKNVLRKLGIIKS